MTSAFQPTDLVALMDQLTPSDAIRFTRDFNDLSLDVKKLRGRLGVFIPTRSAVEDAQLSKGGDVRRLRAEVTMSALKSAVVFLGTLREGRKSVIFVSEGHSRPRQQMRPGHGGRGARGEREQHGDLHRRSARA